MGSVRGDRSPRESVVHDVFGQTRKTLHAFEITVHMWRLLRVLKTYTRVRCERTETNVVASPEMSYPIY